MRDEYNFKELNPKKNPFAKLLKRQMENRGESSTDFDKANRETAIADLAAKLMDENDEVLLLLAESRLATANEADYISDEDLIRELGTTNVDLVGIEVEIE